MSPDDLIKPEPPPEVPEDRVTRARVVGRPHVDVGVIGSGRLSSSMLLGAMAAAMNPDVTMNGIILGLPRLPPPRRVDEDLAKHPTPAEQEKIASSLAKRERQQLTRCTPCPQCNARGPLQAKSLCTSPDTCELRKLDRTLRGLCRPKDWNERVRRS